MHFETKNSCVCVISFNITGKKSNMVLKHITNSICETFYKQIIITLKIC